MFERLRLLVGAVLLSFLVGCGGSGGGEIQKSDASEIIRNKSGGISWEELSRIFAEVDRKNPGVSQERFSELLTQALINVPSSSERGIPYNGLNVTWEEVWLLIKHPQNILPSKSCFYDALGKAAELYDSSILHLGKGDAFRHAYWNILLCKRVNESWANQYTTAHESESSEGAEKYMDLHNNSVGRSIYRQNASKSETDFVPIVFYYTYTKIEEGVSNPSVRLDQLVFIEEYQGLPITGGGGNPPPDDGGGGSSPPPSDDGNGGSPPVLPPPGGGDDSDDDPLPPPPEPDRTAPIIESSSIDFKGDGKYNLIAEVSDSESGIDCSQFWLQDPGYNFLPVGDKNWEVSTLLEVNLTSKTAS